MIEPPYDSSRAARAILRLGWNFRFARRRRRGRAAAARRGRKNLYRLPSGESLENVADVYVWDLINIIRNPYLITLNL